MVFVCKHKTAYEMRISDWSSDVCSSDLRSRAALQVAILELRARRAKTSNAAVLQDLDILIDSAQQSVESSMLNQQLLLPYQAVAGMVFGGIKALLDPRIPKERQAAALLRLRRYAGLEPGTTPLTKLAEMRTQERFSDKKLVGPYRGEVEQDIADAPRFIDGIAKLFAASDIKGYDAPLATLSAQPKAYEEWTRAQILPRAPTHTRPPPGHY